ncbi:hypothetical protein AJ80_02281 [Polytolypa hystricis UAMH7299]|uniref:Uncharacterized protein n=1 Tax=Polytolypa hystricis (strain UAMH7299) TaxID=1447883 RepID=A0A2B7YQT0_POLH7|nr:hypothetical protein AJ80_02281 [Polytolypa hystricis UAMH7299]
MRFAASCKGVWISSKFQLSLLHSPLITSTPRHRSLAETAELTDFLCFRGLISILPDRSGDLGQRVWLADRAELKRDTPPNTTDLQGPSDIDKFVEEPEEVEFPPARDDSRGWIPAFREHAYDRCISYMLPGERVEPRIGDDALDITAWISAERKAKGSNNKDPLNKNEIEGIKNCLVMQLE